METNYGSLGALGTAYYPGFPPTNVAFGQGGALANTGDNDPSVGFTGGNSANSYLFVPLKSPAMYLKPPVTFECWINTTALVFGDIMGNGGANGDGSGNWSGIRMTYAGNNVGGPALQAYVCKGSGTSYNEFTTPPNSLTVGNWHYCVMTYDGTSLLLYVDGVQETNGTTPMAANYWTPLTIGAARWDKGLTRFYKGLLDEAAVYTNVLSALQITNHYLAGITSGSNYMQTILADNPLLYYRMDNALTNPSPTTYPTAVNFGTAPVNGAYVSGIVPGGVSGPSIAPLGTNSVAAPINGVYSCVDAGYDPSFNPTGTQPFTAMTWFRTYPSDERVQAIMGQGQNWGMVLDGTQGKIVWTNSASPSVTSTNKLNDGQWHFVAGVYDGTKSYLYVDGALNNSAVATGGLTGDTNDLFLGGDAAYTFAQDNWGSWYFAGALAQAAFFTNALTVAQIQQAYNIATPIMVTPTISVTGSGNNVTIIYVGTLLSSANVTGPYTTNSVGGAISPYKTPATNAQQFYRSSSP
jgi:hypothetical protein